MGLFNNFPYMDLSNLNLDFVLKKMKDLNNYTDSAKQDANRAETAKTIAVTAQTAAESAARSAESSARDAQTAETSAENYAAHIADPVAGLVTTWLGDHITNPSNPPLDTSLTVANAAADAKATGDAITDLRSLLNNAMPVEVRHALDTIVQNLAFKNNAGYANEVSVFHAWASAINIVSITAVYTQSGTVYNVDSLDSLRSDLVVTANYDNGTSAVVTTYVLSGNLQTGTSTITVTYSGQTTTFNVTVTALTPSWTLGNGVNQRTVGSLTYLSATTSEARAIYAVSNATYAPLKVDSAQSETNPPDSNLYPMKIPAGAKAVKITTPADVYVAAYDVSYSAESVYKWVRLTTTGWINPSSENTFTFNASATHFNLACKHGSAGTANVTQSDVTGIVIEYIYE